MIMGIAYLLFPTPSLLDYPRKQEHDSASLENKRSTNVQFNFVKNN
jgi:hypothetical protein